MFPGMGDEPPNARALAVAILIAVCVALAVILGAIRHEASVRARGGARPAGEHYSVGFQMGPEYSGYTAWDGIPYVFSAERGGWYLPEQAPRGACGAERFSPSAPPDEGLTGRRLIARNGRGPERIPNLVYEPPITNDLRGSHPNWWRPDGGSYGLPPAADRPDFWAGDMTIHTYRARDPIPPLCSADAVAAHDRRPTAAENVETWRYYGGPKGWNFSPYY